MLHFHHDMHHKTYVDDLNTAELKLLEARRNNNFKMTKYWENELVFNGSGHILHSIYWTNITTIGQVGQPGPLP
jgi:superoxide dismutase, Fe-Mn family